MSNAYEAGRKAFYSPIGSFASPDPKTPYGREWLRGFRAEAANPTGIPGTPLGPDCYHTAGVAVLDAAPFSPSATDAPKAE